MIKNIYIKKKKMSYSLVHYRSFVKSFECSALLSSVFLLVNLDL